ncbi:MAG TPA: AsnC family transcriptional regulator [Candidatus Avidesulfovibrio excrementigallinarum]|nr:AsnC family transcriptional regulator [Candidatus Avidesulfovibrio excrementigallinarum]
MTSPSFQLDTTDKRLLDIIQTGFPLCSHPYAELGRQLGLTEAETLARVRALRGRGIIRRLGANFRSNALGFTSTLCAASVPEDKLDAFVSEVNSHVGVTHNYLRNHHYNVWFTVISPSAEALAELLAGITERTGVRVLNLPATRMYKIRVDFQMEE